MTRALLLLALILGAAHAYAPARPLPRAAPPARRARGSAAAVAPRMLFGMGDAAASSGEASAAVDAALKGAKVVVFTAAGAASTKTVECLKAAKADYKAVPVASIPGAQAELRKRSGGKGAAPLVFIKGEFAQVNVPVLADQGMLSPLLRQTGATKGELRLPFQDLRMYLAKINQ